MKKLIATVCCLAAFSAQAFELSSADMKEGQKLDTAQVFNGFGCLGGNVAPQLSWKNPPKDAKSFAVTVYDPDAPTGSGWWHWIVYDIPASFVALPGSIRMLAKKELFGIPIFGAAIRAAEFPSVDRHNRHQAVKDLEQARRMMESGIVLWAAPEGTRSKDGQLLPFKKGCFHLALDTNAIIVPIVFRGIHEVLPARTWRFNLGLPVQLHIGAPIDASRFSPEQLPELMAQTRQSMQALLGEPAPSAPRGRLTEQPV